MIWTLRYAASVKKSVKKLDRQTQERIRYYLEERLAPSINPRLLGKPLKGRTFQGLWRFRVGDYRIVARIEDETIEILVLRIAHRKGVYKT